MSSRRIVVFCYTTILLAASIVTSNFFFHVSSDTVATHSHRVLLANKHNDFQHLRFLAFGTSRTYGVGVNHQSKAFPSLLSRNNSKNLAMKASGPHYSALCTQTMVGSGNDGGEGADDGNGLYDVILFEYNLMADNYILILARRLRARFPQAKMVFLRIWLPFQYRHIPSNMGVLPMIRERYGTAANTMMAQEILDSLVEGTQSDDWAFHEAVDKMDLLDRISREVGGHVYHMPRPENAIEAMKTFGLYYTPDMNHFSHAGHRFLQQELVKVLHEINAVPTDLLGTWTDTDVCHLWYETGVIPLARDAPIATFLNNHYALEFHNPELYMEIRNPFPDRQVSVLIDFMAGSPKGQYPISQVQISQSSPVEIDPGLKGKTELHVMKHAQVGMLEPAARGNVTVRALDYGASNHFRIVGVAYTTVRVDGIQDIE